MSNETDIKAYKRRWADLQNERQSWIPHWQDLSTHILPRNGRFLLNEQNKGYKRHNSIYNNTATRDVRIMAAGLMGGATSPARPWFRLGLTNKDLMDYAPVKEWLAQTADIMRTVFARSNTYQSLQQLYEELIVFGTGADIIVPDYDNVMHNHAQTVGQYAIATDDKGRVTTLYREFAMTVGQMVKAFGLEALSDTLKTKAREGKGLDEWVSVIHAIEPRSDRNPRLKTGQNMAWASCYFESKAQDNDKVLSESGFKRFPGIGVRWAVRGGDIYGESPCMEALGDIKELKHTELRASQARDYMVRPPLQAPASIRDTGIDMLPGGITWTPDAAGGGVKPLFEVRPAVETELNRIQVIETRIHETLYRPLFLMLEGMDTHQMTAREIAERHEEKLLMLGPVLERLHDEALSPMIDIAFDRMIEADLVPPAPPEMQGEELSVEFISVLAQAQRAVGVTAIDRLLGTVGGIAQLRPEAVDKLDIDTIIDGYADALGCDPDYIVANEQVAIIRQQRAQEMAQQQAMANAVPASQAIKNVAQANQGGQMEDLLQQFQGYGGPG